MCSVSGDELGWRGVALSDAGRESVDSYLELINHFDQLIEKRQQRLEQQAGQSAPARWLTTIPGIGPYLAMVILAEIGDIRLSPQEGPVQLRRAGAARASRRANATMRGSPIRDRGCCAGP